MFLNNGLYRFACIFILVASMLFGSGCGIYRLGLPDKSARPITENNGRLVFDVERIEPAGQWVFEDKMPGYFGKGYFTWKGPDLFNKPGEGLLAYPFNITTPGKYRFRLRNRHDHEDSTLENDCWVRMDGREWTKLFSPEAGRWTESSNFDFHTRKPIATYELETGDHLLEISGRSANFSIDAIILTLMK